MSTFSPLAGIGQEVAARPGLVTRGVNTLFGGLGTLANVLDTPGSIVRGIINTLNEGGDEWERIFTGVFDPSQRVTGTELLGGPNDKFTLAGLAAEILTDPLTFATFGAKTAVGELAKRAGKLSAQETVQSSLVRQGADVGERLLQTKSKLAGTQAELLSRGRDAGELLEKSIREQFASGQRALVQLDIPFTNIRDTLFNNSTVGKVVGSFADTAAATITGNPISREIRDKFVTTRKNPIEEELRKEINREVSHLTQKARVTGKDLTRQRMLLLAKDPDVDLKIARIIEENADLLDIPTDTPTPASSAYMGKLLNTRLRVEELYGEIDNFEDTWAFAQQVRRLNKETLALEQAAGVPVSEFSDMGYFARILTSEGSQLLRTSKKGRDTIVRHFNKLDAGTPGTFQHARKFKSLGVDDLNKQLATIYGKDPNSFKFFDTDVVSVQVNRMIDSARQVGRARFSRAVVDLFGVERANKLIKVGAQIGVEKLISPRGPFVTSMRLNVQQSAKQMADHFVRRGLPIDKLGKTGVRVAGYEFDDVTEEVAEQAVNFRLRKPFRNISKQHEAVDDQLQILVNEGTLRPEQHRFLRTWMAQVKPEHLDNLKTTTLTDSEREALAQIYEDDVFSSAAGLFGSTPQDVRERPFVQGAGLGDAQPTIGVIPPGLGKGTVGGVPTSSDPGKIFTFLHELGHSHHLAYMDAADVNLVDDIFTDYLDDVTRDKFVTGASASRNFNAAEMYANAYAAWVLGHRTTSATLEKIFKKTHTEFKRLRDTIYNPEALSKARAQIDNLPRRHQEEVLEDLGDNQAVADDLTSLFVGTTEDHATVLNNLPNQPRKAFLADLLEPVHTRMDYVEFSPRASEKEVREALLSAGVERTALEPEVMDFAEKFLSHSRYHLDSDKWWAKTIRVMDELHGMFRTAFTQYFPAFHSRNFLSNVFMNSMAGGVGLKHYVRAMNQLRTMDAEEALYLASLNVVDSGKIREVFEFMQNSRGGVSRSVSQLMGKLPGGDTLKRAGGAINEGARATGHGVENIGRLAHYLAKRDAGLTDTEAADSVVKYLFDYNDLTDFERAVPRRTMLFYTFFRKNLPLMLEQTFKNPRFMSLYARATGQNNPHIVQPDWMPDGFFFGEDEQGRTIRLNFGLPPEDMARFDPEGKGLSRVFEIMISNLVPVIREPFQFVSGKDLFTGRPREGGALEVLAGNLPTARATGTVERIAKAAEGTDPNLSLGPEVGRALFGVARRPIDENIQRKMNELDSVRDRLKELVRQGDAKTIEIVGQRDKNNPNLEVQQLNSMQSRILRELSRLRNQ